MKKKTATKTNEDEIRFRIRQIELYLNRINRVSATGDTWRLELLTMTIQNNLDVILDQLEPDFRFFGD